MIDGYQTLETEANNQLEMAELGELEGDDSIVNEAEAALTQVAAKLKKLETESLLSGEADANDCFIEINSGAGGTESQDWAAMLERCLLYTSPSPRDQRGSRMPSSA